jgi:uncharacterized membrane protein
MKQHRMKEESTPERVNAFSDGVFAIIITIMVLELKKPEGPSFEALFKLWPTWISYAVSYLFIAIVWINHHYLLRHAAKASLRLIWANFGHLFSVSLIPFLTAWMAETRLAAVPVAMYAAVFFLVNATYLALVWETLLNKTGESVSDQTRRLLHIRSFLTLALFAIAMMAAFWHPLIGFAIICCCLILYLRPAVSRKEW